MTTSDAALDREAADMARNEVIYRRMVRRDQALAKLRKPEPHWIRLACGLAIGVLSACFSVWFEGQPRLTVVMTGLAGGVVALLYENWRMKRQVDALVVLALGKDAGPDAP